MRIYCTRCTGSSRREPFPTGASESFVGLIAFFKRCIHAKGGREGQGGRGREGGAGREGDGGYKICKASGTASFGNIMMSWGETKH